MTNFQKLIEAIGIRSAFDLWGKKNRRLPIEELSFEQLDYVIKYGPGLPGLILPRMLIVAKDNKQLTEVISSAFKITPGLLNYPFPDIGIQAMKKLSGSTEPIEILAKLWISRNYDLGHLYKSEIVRRLGSASFEEMKALNKDLDSYEWVYLVGKELVGNDLEAEGIPHEVIVLLRWTLLEKAQTLEELTYVFHTVDKPSRFPELREEAQRRVLELM